MHDKWRDDICEMSESIDMTYEDGGQEACIYSRKRGRYLKTPANGLFWRGMNWKSCSKSISLS